MTENDLKSVIRRCPIRNDFLKHERYLTDVICRSLCLPCILVLKRGKCPQIKEFLAKEKEKK